MKENTNLKVGEIETKSVSIIIDNDKELQYEKHSWIVEIFRVPIMLILDMLPKKIGKLLFIFGGKSDVGTKAVYEHATSYKALELLYTYPERRKKGELSFTDVLWGSFLNNSLAVRNRLKLEKRELAKIIIKSKKHKTKMRLMSLGSGSGRAIIETLAQLNEVPSPVDVKLIDISRNALNFSKDLALRFGVKNIEYHRDYIQNLEKYCNEFQPDVVEMVGVLDYCSNEIAVDLIQKIYKVLADDGYLITGNICPNLEQSFVTKAINWRMVYRTPQELGNIVVEGGFAPYHVKIICEPLQIHALAICQKIV